MKKTLSNNTKKMIRIGLTDEEEAVLISYSKGTKQSLSAAGRSLILSGFENILRADEIKNSVNFSISKLERKNEELQNIIKENEKKTMKMMMHILKYAAKNNSLVKTFEGNREGNKYKNFNDFLIFADKVETSALTKMFAKLKEKEDEKDFEEKI